MNVDRMVELIQTGMPEYFRDLLTFAMLGTPVQSTQDAAVAALAELGVYLRNDGQWRAQIKLQKGWDGHGTAWEALTAFCADHDDGAPWWRIFDYADGNAVTDEVAEFFTAGTK